MLLFIYRDFANDLLKQEFDLLSFVQECKLFPSGCCR